MTEVFEGSIPNPEVSMYDLKLAYGKVASRFPHVAFMVDIEGVIYPFHFSFDEGKKISFLEPDTIVPGGDTARVRHAQARAVKLRENKALFDIVEGLAPMSKNTSIASASLLDLGTGEALPKLDPIYGLVVERAHRKLAELANKTGARYQSLHDPLPANSLLLVLNDRIDDSGNPSEKLIASLMQKVNGRSFSLLPIKVPVFLRRDNDSTSYNRSLYEAFSAGLRSEPRPLATPERKVMDFSRINSRPRVNRRPGD